MSVPLALEYDTGIISNLFRKFAEIIANECCQVVNDTGDKIEKFSGIIFSFFVKSLVEYTLHLKIEFLLIFHFQV
jgi:hypothetical protein